MPQIILDGKYRLDECLGEGATGVVYRALHLGLKKAFAVKLLKSGSPDADALSLARFRREAEALGQLRHPHVVEVTDFGIDAAAGEIPYLVMELLEGITLADFCREHGPLPLARALPLLEAIAEAVDAAHTQGVLHRDLKPGNILLCSTAAGEPFVKVLDFGLAEISKGSLTRSGEDFRSGGEIASGECLTATGALLGTPLYVAPELIREHAATRASDLYSFGVVAYELLAGHPPFQGSTAKVLAGHLDEEPPVPTHLLTEVWEVLQESLRKDPGLRPTSASDLVRRVRRAAERPALQRWWAGGIPRRVGFSIGFTMVVLLAGLLLPWSMLHWTEQWLQDLVARSVPAHSPDGPKSNFTVDKASLGNEAGHPHRQAAETGGDVGGEGRGSLTFPAVSSLPTGGQDAPGRASKELGKVDDVQAPGAKEDNDEAVLQAAEVSGIAALTLNDSAPPRNVNGMSRAPSLPSVDLEVDRSLGLLPEVDGILHAGPRQDVELGVLAAPFRANEAQAYVPVIIEIGGRGLLAGHTGDKLNLELYIYVADKKGNIRDFFTQSVGLDIKDGSDALERTGVKYYGHLDLMPGEYQVRVLVRNADTGRTGVEAVPLSIPDYAKAEPHLLPPLFIEREPGWLMIRERERKGQQATVVYPFTVKGEPFVPAARPVLRPDRSASLCLVGYNLGGEDLKLEGQVVAQDGKALSGGRLSLVERTATDISGLDKVLATFQPTGLAAGNYILRVAVRSGNGRHEESSLPFVVH